LPQPSQMAIEASLDLSVLDLRTEAQGAEYEKNNNDCSDQPNDVVHASSHVSSYAWGQRRRAATRIDGPGD
ncbi:MAG: hypothetical protein WBZ22_27740, partial [Pseudolabrys sp.]